MGSGPAAASAASGESGMNDQVISFYNEVNSVVILIV